MKPVSTSSIVLLGLAIVIAIGSWAYLWQRSEVLFEEVSNLTALKKEFAESKVRIEEYEQQKELYADSLMKLNVEKGQAEIELNRNRAELQKANQRYTNLRISNEVEKALSVCDSIVYTYIPGYIHSDTVVLKQWDSVYLLQSNLSNYQYVVIDSTFNKVDSSYKAQIADKVVEQQKSKADKKQRRIKAIKAGAVGAAFGVILALLLGG